LWQQQRRGGSGADIGVMIAVPASAAVHNHGVMR
jgi:hypothetical protein